MTTYPALIPSSRTFTPGEYPATAFSGYSGAQGRVRHSNVFLAAQLRLSYIGLSEAEMLQIWNHYAARYGSHEAFPLPVEVLSGSDVSDYVPATYQWIYGGPGQVEDLPCGGHNVSLTLETAPPVPVSLAGVNLRLRLSLVGGEAFNSLSGINESITLSLEAGDAFNALNGINEAITFSLETGDAFSSLNGINESITLSLEAGQAIGDVSMDGINESITLSLEAGQAIGDLQVDGINEAITFSLVGGIGSVSSALGINETITFSLNAGAASAGGAEPEVIGSFINSASAADTSHTLDAPTHQEGDLLIAVLMWRSNKATLTVPSGWSLHGTYMSSIVFSGNQQNLLVYTKTAGASEPASYTWSAATSTRNCGLIVSVRNGAIDTVTENYGNGTTATISTVAGKLNLTVFTWIYASNAAEAYFQTISAGSITEISDSSKARARISGGYTESAATVTSTHSTSETADDPNHGGINIQIVGA